MSRPLVYLAGPIAGYRFDDVNDWREVAREALSGRGVEALSPMRRKRGLDGANPISTDFRQYATHGAFYSSRGIMTRDHIDVLRADALLVNLLGASKPSLGTVMELAWAFAYNKPTVVAIENTGNVHDNHPMIHEAIGFRVDNLADAIDAVAVILNR